NTGIIPLGHDLKHANVHLLNPWLRHVPTWMAGEIYVGGEAVGRGYLGQPAATAAAFLPDPFSNRAGSRLYATGDRARSTPAGLAFIGRTDGQVKVRGTRVELAEVEIHLRELAGVNAAAVVAVPAADGTP